MLRRFYSSAAKGPVASLSTTSPAGRSRLKLYSGLFLASTAIGYSTKTFALDDPDVPVHQTKDTPAAQKYLKLLKHTVDKLPIVEKLRSDPRYIESAAWDHIESTSKNGIMTSGILSTIGGLSIAPRVFVNKEDKSIIAVVHYGYLLTGLLFFAHGGILGTLLDDALARTGGLSIPSSSSNKVSENGLPKRTQYGQTKSLSIIYKKPTVVNQFLVIRTSTDSRQGSIVHVSGSIQSMDKQTLVKAHADIDISKQTNSVLGLSFWPFRQ